MRGFTLLEVMFSMVIFGIAAAGMTHGFAQMQHRNWEYEVRSGAIGAAQEVLDRLRVADPYSMPDSGSSSQSINYADRDYEIITTYCAESSYCSSSNIRHVRIGVNYLGKTRYRVDTVFCQLK